jgi:preprotein translocase subunit YajC
MFFSSAFAQATAAGADQSMFGNLGSLAAPLVMMLAVFYFIVYMPQRRRDKEVKQAQSALRRGDRIITAGGIIGQVSRVINDDEIEVQIAEGVKVRVVKSTVQIVTTKSEPAGKDTKPEAESAEGEEGAAVKKRRTPTSAK